MSAAADRNLLFGILALQMDFITRDQLVEGMNAWVLAKHRPLGDILAERGALAAADNAVLAPMVERHVAKHGGAAQSLAALSSIAPVKDVLAQLPDAEVQASLAQLAVTKEQPDVPQTVSVEPAPMGTRYIIERPHARGGLGEVFVARDSELNRKVALKHIQDRHADDPASQSLFLVEGEITGGLEHPGIIPVYGLGRYADGRPFYAMRFVEGDSLLTAIERFHCPKAPLSASAANLAFRELLRRFLDVCNAVAYAHRRGVLHRDLKPGNVLLGEFGETLVIDWGMAKVLGKASTDHPASEGGTAPLVPVTDALATVGNAAHGTPGYMSPEQAGGRIGELGPATDIYSLGATLYHLLAGRPPLTRDDGDVIGRAIRGDFPPPRQVKPEVPHALEAICSKALALRPEDCYGSVQALAEDVEHWLADEAVSAWQEPFAARARRWMRKNPGRVAALTAAVLVGLLTTGVGAALIGVKNRELDDANSGLKQVWKRVADTRQ